MLHSDKAKSTARLVLRTGALTATIFVITIIASLNLIFAESERVNSETYTQENRRFITAVETRLSEKLAQFATIASGRSQRNIDAGPVDTADLKHDFTTNLWAHFGFGSAYVITSGNRVLFGQENGQAAGQGGFDALYPVVESAIADVRRREAS
ncbi:MAG: hypothetical protein ACRCWO_04910, partial [Bosea sp. (in: a-proteobacteria)]